MSLSRIVYLVLAALFVALLCWPNNPSYTATFGPRLVFLGLALMCVGLARSRW